FEYSFGFAPDSYGSYRRTILMARSSGTAHPKSADVGASAYFVELYINGSSFEYLVGYNQGGAVTTAMAGPFSGASASTNGWTHQITLVYDADAKTLTLTVYNSFSPTEGTKTA